VVAEDPVAVAVVEAVLVEQEHPAKEIQVVPDNQVLGVVAVAVVQQLQVQQLQVVVVVPVE
jgi:hypothetical protein